MTELPVWRLKRRQSIVAAASRLFACEPFESVQMDEIARAAEVGKPTLYRYFPSKQDLYLAVCEEAFRDLERRLEEAAQGCSPTEGLARMIAALVTVLDGKAGRMVFAGQDQGALPGRWHSLVRRHRQAVSTSLRMVLEAGLRKSEFHNLDLDMAPGVIMGMIRGGLIAGVGVPRARLIEQMTTFILKGLGAGGGAAGTEPDSMQSRRAGGC